MSRICLLFRSLYAKLLVKALTNQFDILVLFGSKFWVMQHEVNNNSSCDCNFRNFSDISMKFSITEQELGNYFCIQNHLDFSPLSVGGLQVLE